MARIPPSNVGGPRRTTNTTATANTTATTDTSASASSWSPPPLRSASGDIVPTRRAVIDGLQGGTMTASNTGSRFSRDSSFDSYEASGDGRVNRAFIRVDAEPLPGGCRLNVKSFHAQKDDKVTLWLTAEVLDTKANQLRTITLSTLANSDVINPGSYRGDLHFDISYDEVNKYLQAMNPNLKLNPGHTSLAVAARWANGHQAGGFGRGGVFRLPADRGTTNVVGVRAASRTADEADLPLDMQVAYPPTLTRSISALKPDGNILSRLESELKGTASKQEMTTAVTKMYDLVAKARAGDKQSVEAALGKGWSVKTVDRYWLKDDGSAGQPGKAGQGIFKGFRVDDDGLPMQDPMRDQYMDDRHLGMTRLEGAIRLRKNKQATVINVKPGGGREDQRTDIRQRVEYGLELKPDADVSDAGDALRSLSQSWGQWSGTPFNIAQREVAKLQGDVNLASALEPWLEVTQDRHKFTVLNEATGVEIEFSFDKVQTQTMRPELANADGSARSAEFYVLEAELDHLQLASQNQGTFAAAGDVNATAFSDDSAQTTWLSGSSDQVTMDIDPRLHELKDLENDSFRSTTSYKQFETASAKIVPWLFPSGLGHGRQKAAHAAEVLGLVHFNDASLKQAVSEVFTGSGYVWDSKLQQAFDQALQDPQKRTRIENGLLDGARNNPYQFARNTVGDQALNYDVPLIKQRVADSLNALGYATTPEIDKMLDGLTTAKLEPRSFEATMRRMDESKKDADVMAGFAKALGVSPAPTPTPEVARLLGPNASYGQRLRQQLDRADLDPALAPKLEKYFEDAVAGGATVAGIRREIRSFANSPAGALKDIDKMAPGLTAPALRHDADKLVAETRSELGQHYLLMTPEIESFVRTFASAHDYKEANAFMRSFGGKPGPTLEKHAAADGVQAPKLSYDLGIVDDLLEKTLDRHGITNAQELVDFAHKALDAGVTVPQLDKAYDRLSSTGDLAKAFKTGRVKTQGLTIPDVKYDAQKALNDLTTRIANYQHTTFQGAPELKKFLEELLGHGLTPYQAVNYATYAYSGGRASAASSYAGGVDHKKLPPLPIDVSEVKAALKKNMGNAWSPAHEQYLDAALPKALNESPGFKLGELTRSWRPRDGFTHLSRCSGIKLPDGI
jgi:hypothetical protein